MKRCQMCRNALQLKVSRRDGQYSDLRRTAFMKENSDQHDDEKSIRYLLCFYQILEKIVTLTLLRKLTINLGPKCEETRKSNTIKPTQRIDKNLTVIFLTAHGLTVFQINKKRTAGYNSYFTLRS